MGISIHDLTKRYGGQVVIDRLNLELEDGKTYCLMGPSGSGKTTLIRLLLKLEKPDQGTIKGLEKKKISAVFQENRLCETFSAVENVSLTAPKGCSKAEIETMLAALLPADAIHRPVSTLSGGMKRRTAICRALISPWDVLIMDEPFSGLDQDTKHSVISYIRSQSAGKLLILSTHQEEDVELLNGIPLRLWK